MFYILTVLFFTIIDPTGLVTGGWAASILDTSQWLQLDMTEPYKYQKVIIQGRQDEAMWVTLYKIWYSTDGVTFLQYADHNATDVRHLKLFVLFLEDKVPYALKHCNCKV